MSLREFSICLASDSGSDTGTLVTQESPRKNKKEGTPEGGDEMGAEAEGDGDDTGYVPCAEFCPCPF